jgi:hypothetical protein
MSTTIIFPFALAATPALARPRLEVPVTITATEATPTPLCFFFFCGLSLGAVPDGAGSCHSQTAASCRTDLCGRMILALMACPALCRTAPTRPWRPCPRRILLTMIRRRRRLSTMLRGALLPRRLGSGTIQTRHPRRYPTPASGWNRNEQGGAAGPGLKSKPVLDLGEFCPARADAGRLARMLS